MDSGFTGKVIQFSKLEISPFSDEYLKKELLNKNKYGRSVGGRFSIPVWGDYKKLAADVQRMQWCGALSDCHPFSHHFILPFFFSKKHNTISTDGLDELCSWTVKHSLHPGATEAEVRSVYEHFINWVDNELMAGEPTWQSLRGLALSAPPPRLRSTKGSASDNPPKGPPKAPKGSAKKSVKKGQTLQTRDKLP